MTLEKDLVSMKSTRVSTAGPDNEMELSGLFTSIRTQIDGLKNSVVASNMLGGKMELSEQVSLIKHTK